MKRVVICTDIGNDPDDEQSLIHALFYTDVIDLVGIIPGPKGGTKKPVLKIIKEYEKDFDIMESWNEYDSPDYLRSIVKQGAKNSPGSKGWDKPTPGSKWIVAKAKESTEPLYVCCWGGVCDVAQAIHQEPKIIPKLFIYAIGTTNQEENSNAYDYIKKIKKLKMISTPGGTYRGMFLTGNGAGKYSNKGFVKQVIKPAGHLGAYYYKISKDINIGAYGMKEGDTPSFLFMINGEQDPLKPSWGGKFKYAGNNKWIDRPEAVYKIGNYLGAKTVSAHRLEILKDWEKKIHEIYG